MKTIFAFVILLFIVTATFGQIKYEKGYFINQANERIECLIKNMDWKTNPVNFSYKLEDSSTPEVGNLTSMKEFGIYSYCKFIAAEVKIDRSSNSVNRLTNENDPVWSNEKIFLQLILEGKANLYYYEDRGVKRFFYSATDTAINQLIYKRYIIDQGIAENNGFRQQLWSYLRCENSDTNIFQNIKYTSTDLKKYIQFYNRCFGDTTTEIRSKIKREYLKIKLTPGLNLSSMTISNSIVPQKKMSFETYTGFRLGLESELILPFNMNKWGIVFEPTYQYYNAEKEDGDKSASIKFKSIEFPLGLRYYLYLNDHTKLFFNGFYNSNFALNFESKIQYRYQSERTTLDISSQNSFAFGGGVDRNRLSVEVRYYTNRNMSGNYLYWSTDYSRFSVILGYKILNAKH